MILVSPSPQLRKEVKALKALKQEEISIAIENSTCLGTKEKSALKTSLNLNFDRKAPLANWN